MSFFEDMEKTLRLKTEAEKYQKRAREHHTTKGGTNEIVRGQMLSLLNDLAGMSHPILAGTTTEAISVLTADDLKEALECLYLTTNNIAQSVKDIKNRLEKL